MGAFRENASPFKAFASGDGSHDSPLVPSVAYAITGTSSVLTPTTSGANYADGDCVGGIQSIATVNLASGRRVALRSLQVNDRGGNAVAMDLYFFKATPAAGTYTDNSGVAWGTGDSANKVGQVTIKATDWLTANSQSSVNFSNLLMKMAVAATTLFMVIVARGAATIANGDLTLALEFDTE